MRGRALFGIARPFLIILACVAGIIPQCLLEIMWSMISPFDGPFFRALRYILIKAKAKRIGDNVGIGAGVIIKHWDRLSCGSNVSIQAYCYLDCDGGITIGDNVSIAHATSLVSANHTWNDAATPIKYNPLRKKGVVIEDDVWIGCGVRILDGVSIGKRTAVAAGAIVNKSFLGGVLVGGVPAKIIKNIS